MNPGPPFNGRRGQIGDHQVPELANAPGQSSYFKAADWSTQTFCSTIFLTSAQATAIGKKQIDCPSDLLVSAYAKLGLSICSLPVAQQGFFIRQANLCILPISQRSVPRITARIAPNAPGTSMLNWLNIEITWLKTRTLTADENFGHFAVISAFPCPSLVPLAPGSLDLHLLVALVFVHLVLFLLTFHPLLLTLHLLDFHCFFSQLCHALLICRDEVKFAMYPNAKAAAVTATAELLKWTERKTNTPISAMMQYCFCCWIWAWDKWASTVPAIFGNSINSPPNPPIWKAEEAEESQDLDPKRLIRHDTAWHGWRVSTAASNAGVSGCHVNLKPIELRFRRVEVRHERRTSVSRNRTEETRDRTWRVKKAAYNCEHGSKSNRALIFNVQGHIDQNLKSKNWSTAASDGEACLADSPGNSPPLNILASQHQTNHSSWIMLDLNQFLQFLGKS